MYERSDESRGRLSVGWLWVCAVAALTLTAVGVWIIPEVLTWADQHVFGLQQERGASLAAISSARTSVTAAIGSLIILGSAFFAARTALGQIGLVRTGLATERFTKATELLGNKDGHVRAGGVYALERLAVDSAIDGAAISDLLCAYVRSRSSALLAGTGALPSRVMRPHIHAYPCDVHDKDALRTYLDFAVTNSLIVRAPDVSAAIIVLGRSERWRSDSRLELAAIDLRNANLRDANLDSAYLVDACLEGVWLRGAVLRKADLDMACLLQAQMREVILIGASMRGVDLDGAALHGSNCTEAFFHGARMRSAHLSGAVLCGARFDAEAARHGEIWGPADLAGADLANAQLAGANFAGANLQGASLVGAQLSASTVEGVRWPDVILAGAQVDDETKWPVGFDSTAWGVARI